ncbi:hypothetical protein [Pseudarthrobacter sp. NamE5]|uniref:hypothetical protein n=1 Tax=Pseudarthrobacter sp. NamE5 TaxID=2576839 RepID=UPI001485E2AD|nr:hypothetical protein [Pseudarthrobacter sp. NamE5]
MSHRFRSAQLALIFSGVERPRGRRWWREPGWRHATLVLLLFLYLQKFIVDGLTAGSVK